jgi:RNA polymerase sigma-70 factor (ECF subfamily)
MAIDFESTSLGLVRRLTAPVTDAKTWERFVRTYGPQIIQWCQDHGLQEADALDVSQEVLLRISRQIPRLQYDPERSFRGWLYAVVHGAWVDWVEANTSRWRPAGLDAQRKPLVSDSLFSMPAREELLNRLAACYDLELFQMAAHRVRTRVSPQTWNVFERVALWGETSNEVSQQMNITAEAVRATRSRVQDLLREEVHRLEQHG